MIQQVPMQALFLLPSNSSPLFLTLCSTMSDMARAGYRQCQTNDKTKHNRTSCAPTGSCARHKGKGLFLCIQCRCHESPMAVGCDIGNTPLSHHAGRCSASSWLRTFHSIVSHQVKAHPASQALHISTPADCAILQQHQIAAGQYCCLHVCCCQSAQRGRAQGWGQSCHHCCHQGGCAQPQGSSAD